MVRQRSFRDLAGSVSNKIVVRHDVRSSEIDRGLVRSSAPRVSRRLTQWAAPMLAVLLAACVARPPKPTSDVVSHDDSRQKQAYAVATESQLATEAAEAILERGGNAIDAAIAAALVSGVTVPSSSGIGGGGFALIWDAKAKKATILDFRETAPQALDPAELEKRPPPRGALVGVPGEIAGLLEMHQRWGKLAIKDDFARAIELAEKGFAPGPHVLRAIKSQSAALTECPPLGTWLGVGPGGVAPAGVTPSGINTALGATLRAVVGKGRAGFYEGFVAHWIVDAVKTNGGAISLDDLRGYKVIEREPLRGTWEGFDILTMPAPSAGGLMLLQLLGSFDRADLAAQDPTTAQGAHVLAETIRASVGDRMKHVGDPAFGGHALDGLLAPARLKARRAAIKADASHTPSAFIAEDHGTSHLVVTDAEGNIVSLTTTINGPFGSRVFAEGPGILLNDEMDDFTRRYRASEVGVADPPGVMKPGARPPSSMTPTLVMKNGAPILVIGGSGGMRIATGVSLVTAAVLGRGVALPQAVAQSRLHVSVSGDLLVEPGALDANARRALGSAGERVREETNISAVQGVSWKDGKIEAASDPRKFGVASVHAPK